MTAFWLGLTIMVFLFAAVGWRDDPDLGWHMAVVIAVTWPVVVVFVVVFVAMLALYGFLRLLVRALRPRQGPRP